MGSLNAVLLLRLESILSGVTGILFAVKEVDVVFFVCITVHLEAESVSGAETVLEFLHYEMEGTSEQDMRFLKYPECVVDCPV